MHTQLTTKLMRLLSYWAQPLTYMATELCMMKPCLVGSLWLDAKHDAAGTFVSADKKQCKSHVPSHFRCNMSMNCMLVAFFSTSVADAHVRNRVYFTDYGAL